jgi:hypothetical protein
MAGYGATGAIGTRQTRSSRSAVADAWTVTRTPAPPPDVLASRHGDGQSPAVTQFGSHTSFDERAAFVPRTSFAGNSRLSLQPTRDVLSADRKAVPWAGDRSRRLRLSARL